MNETNKKSEKHVLCDDFQEQASQVLIRHKSILDIMTKLEQYTARINRAVAKSVTSCGCISINAKKQDYSSESFKDNLDTVDSHIEGSLCEVCKEVIEKEMGTSLFYLASMCNALDLNLGDVLRQEYETIKTLGVFSLK